MIGIKQSDCNFYVNKDARIVVCVIPGTHDLLINFIVDNFRFHDFNYHIGLEYIYEDKHLAMPNSFVGKAVCSEEDEWDEETGRLIAFNRAKDKCYRSFFKRANMFVQMLDGHLGDIVSDFNDLGMKVSARKDKLENKIKERLNES